jgi:spore protease
MTEKLGGNMNKVRTDLAEEADALWQGGQAAGVVQRTRRVEGCAVTEVEITTPEGAEQVGKPVGKYVTIHLPAEDWEERAGALALARELSDLVNGLENADGSVLVAGLGNRAITPDAIGPWCVENILVTRHLEAEFPGFFTPVSAVSTSVLGKTGVESGELLHALVEKLHPSLVIAVDALAARSVERLCNTVQLADTGIVPGSGVGNARKALNQETLGVPVVAVGVPTVVDALTLAEELTGVSPAPTVERMIVTPRDIDRQAATCAHLVATGINLALQKLEYEEIMELM